MRLPKKNRKQEDNFMKKKVSFMLAAVMTATLLTGCGGGSGSGNSQPAQGSQASQASTKSAGVSRRDQDHTGKPEVLCHAFLND